MTEKGIASKRILIVGYGKIGTCLAEQLHSDHELWGLRRSACKHEHISFIQADVTQASSLEGTLPDQIDYLIYCLTPNEMSAEGYRSVYVNGLSNVLDSLTGTLKRLFFVSSTSVYHQDDSSWVDEDSSTEPKRFSGQILLEAEQLAAQNQHPSTIVRFSGIYGGNRSRLIDQVAEGSARLTQEIRLTNRIHEVDCVGFIKHLIQQDISGISIESLYLASDSAPVEYNEVISFIANQIGVSLEVSEGAGAAKRRAGNKRCSNQRMLGTGYRLVYPNYQAGYQAMLKDR